MVDSSKFADFTEKAKQNIDQIKIGLLRHDKNPEDREFLNDISKSINSIKNAAEPVGVPRIIELCSNLEELINLIRDKKKELHHEIIITLAFCRDRISKLVFELETIQIERANVTDLVARIQKHIVDYKTIDEPEAEPVRTDADSAEAQENVSTDDEGTSLLPEEVVRKEYDKELFQIFIEQLQENISLLRTLTDSLADDPRKDIKLAQCSNIVGKLQSSTNYMGYEKLSEFYLQWIAQIEMKGVDLAIGTPLSFEFMDQKIKKIVGLFEEIQDIPADPAMIKTSEETPFQPPLSLENDDDEDPTGTESSQEMPSSMDTVGDEEFEDDMEPIAALDGVTSFDEDGPATSEDGQSSSPTKREPRAKKIIEIDGSFLEEEKESENYDEELFQIFVQQLQENLSQLQQLTDSFASEPNKSNIIDKCSNLVGKLQSSANYMGYERLAEYYLQWIAELEMTGVEQSLGSDISIDFMQEKIDRITGLFPEIGEKSSAQPVKRQTPEPPPLEQIAEPEAPVYDDLVDEDEEEEPLAEGIEPIAGLSDDEITESEKPEAAFVEEVRDPKVGEFSEAVDEKLESFFTDIQEPEGDDELETAFMEIASLSDDEVESSEEAVEFPAPTDGLDTLFGEDDDESLAEGIELIASVSDEELPGPEESSPALLQEDPVAETVEDNDGEFDNALNEQLESFFTGIVEPEADEKIDTGFMEGAAFSDEADEELLAAADEIPSPAGMTDEAEDTTTLIDEGFIEGIDAFFGTDESPEPKKADAVPDTSSIDIASFSNETDEKMFELVEEIPSPAAVMDEMSEEEPVTEADLKTDKAEDTTTSIAEGFIEDIDAFFSTDESSEPKKTDE